MVSLIPAGVIAAVKSKCAEVVALFTLITHVYGYAAAPSDHRNRKCVDYMIMNKTLTRAQQIALGDAIAAYYWTNRKRLGLVLLIWNKRILRTYGKTQQGKFYPAGTWAPYNASINPYWTNPHTDHVHVEHDGSAYLAPDQGTKPPMPAPWSGKAEDFPGVAAFQLGQDHPAVIMLDQRLIAWGFTASNDGDGYQAGPTFTQHTLDNVRAFQLAQGWTGTDADGYPGPETWRRLMTDAPAKPAPTPPRETTVDDTFRVAYGNVLRRTDTMAGRLKWALRVNNIAKAFLSASPDVIIACELDKTSAASLGAKLGAEWTWWRLGSGYGPLAIYWREGGRFRRPGWSNIEAALGENRWLLTLPLTHVATGRLVEFCATHLENDGDPKTDGHVARYGEARKIASLTSHDVTAVIGGDLNSTTPSTAKATARQRQKPRPVLRAAGWTGFLTEAVKLVYATHHGGKGAKPKGPAIDELGWRGALSFLSGGLIDTSKTRCSDHHFLWARFKITK